MNLHNWSGKHWSKGARWFSAKLTSEGDDGPEFTAVLPQGSKTAKLRVLSTGSNAIRVQEIRVFKPSKDGYPKAFPSALEAQPEAMEIARSAKVSASSELRPDRSAANAVDGVLKGDKPWTPLFDAEPHWLELDWNEPQEIGAVQLVAGWSDPAGDWHDVSNGFKIQLWNGSEWTSVAERTPKPEKEISEELNLGKSLHVYALDWSEKELVYYFDGQEIRRIPNEICHREAPVYLSLAIIRWAGRVTDEIDGKSMDVQYVRVWQKEAKAK